MKFRKFRKFVVAIYKFHDTVRKILSTSGENDFIIKLISQRSLHHYFLNEQFTRQYFFIGSID